jgi:hypothetical protein
MRYVETETGDFLDTKTNLIWKREPEKDSYDYEEALTLQTGGWRLPTIEELLSIVDYSKTHPATSIPNHTDEYYWSSSRYAGDYAGDNELAWSVYFCFGVSGLDCIPDIFPVRLVRDQVGDGVACRD